MCHIVISQGIFDDFVFANNILKKQKSPDYAWS